MVALPSEPQNHRAYRYRSRPPEADTRSREIRLPAVDFLRRHQVEATPVRRTDPMQIGPEPHSLRRIGPPQCSLSTASAIRALPEDAATLSKVDRPEELQSHRVRAATAGCASRRFGWMIPSPDPNWGFRSLQPVPGQWTRRRGPPRRPQLPRSDRTRRFALAEWC